MMDEYTEETYGERIAGVYDQWYSEFDPAAIEVLADLAQGGQALELGIGSGRIALPLRQKGVSVHGIDASSSMVALLRSKPEGEDLPVTMGNFSEVPVEGQFSLVYVVFNTFFCLLTQDDQVRCFQNVARHLAADGVFLIEAFVPDMNRYIDGQAMRVNRINDHEVGVDVSQVALDKQLITSQHVVFTGQGTRFYPVRIRYVWPSEMDLMARLADLVLKERWSGWNKSPFTSQSTRHVSIYAHPG